jgi:enolase-phosphatase E1
MIRAIVTDIEGTTSSISFVHDVLFPYARAHLAEFLRVNAEDPRIMVHINDVRDEVGEALELEAVIAQLIQWIDEDKKITPLKALQGLIWERGFRAGDFYGHIYADAHEQLKNWQAQGIDLYIYSSGSVYAQKLLFEHTEHGDLNFLFKGNFDTTTGGKKDPDSYHAIIHELQIAPSEVLFLSDVKEELDAAAQAGLHTTWLVRDTTPDPSAEHTQVTNFYDIKPEAL